MILNETAKQRFEICKQCPFYQAETGVCLYIVKHTGRKGRIFHPAGINNLKARCPDRTNRRWLSIPSLHPWVIDTLYYSLSLSESHRFTQMGIVPLDIMSTIYKKSVEKPVRSLLLESLIKLSRTPNQYQHLPFLEVDHISGSLSQRDIPLTTVIDKIIFLK